MECIRGKLFDFVSARWWVMTKDRMWWEWLMVDEEEHLKLQIRFGLRRL